MKRTKEKPESMKCAHTMLRYNLIQEEKDKYKNKKWVVFYGGDIDENSGFIFLKKETRKKSAQLQKKKS